MQDKFSLLILFIFTISCTINKTKKSSFEGIKNFDIHKVLQQASEKEKSVLLYFTSNTCVNCREIETKILNDPTVKQIMNDQYILTTLVVDDHEIADKDYWKNSKIFNRKIKRVGDINLNWQIELTQTGSQPYFLILSKEKTVLSEIGYTDNKTQFLSFLKR